MKIGGKEWSEFIKEKDNEKFVEEIRKATNNEQSDKKRGIYREAGKEARSKFETDRTWQTCEKEKLKVAVPLILIWVLRIYG